MVIELHVANIECIHVLTLGMYGQLGHGNQEKQLIPCKVDALAEKVVYLVSCGTSHTVSVHYILSILYMIQLAVCSDQTIYHWGKNLHKPVSSCFFQCKASLYCVCFHSIQEVHKV